MRNRLFVIKYGGNAMTDDTIKKRLVDNICLLEKKGISVVLIHGGGPFIEEALATANIHSEFIEGQRVTTKEALKHVEMTLKGNVNASLVNLINSSGHKAVGLSGKDGQLVTAEKRYGERSANGTIEEIDLGLVGNVKSVQTELINILIDHKYIPVITCIASDEEGNDYNINADVFAGHIAGSMNADEFIVLTDVDGILVDIDDPDSLIAEIKSSEIDGHIKNGVIKGGMIPKIEACKTSLLEGAQRVRIINGTKPKQLLDLVENKKVGTLIKA